MSVVLDVAAVIDSTVVVVVVVVDAVVVDSGNPKCYHITTLLSVRKIVGLTRSSYFNFSIWL